MMAAQARISIVTPCFNHAPFVEQTLRSVLDQAYPQLEYIVIDGGSTDGSREIIERYSSQLAYWVSEEDRGHAHALNKGFAHTTGEIMAWLNSDDLYLPWTLRTVAEIFAKFPDVHWITGVNAWWDDQGRMTSARENLKNKYDFLLGRYAWIQQESTFWRRSLWEAVGGRLDESYRYMVDGELWTRFFTRAPLHHVGCVLGGFRSWGNNRSASHMDECHAEMRRAIGLMRRGCDAHTRRIALALNGTCRAATTLRGLPVRRLAQYALSGVLEEAGYDRLSYDRTRWQHGRAPFAP
jgi:hypothetical protein